MDPLFLNELASAKRTRLQALQKYFNMFKPRAIEESDPKLKKAAYFVKSVDDDSDDYVGKNLKAMLASELVDRRAKSIDSTTKILIATGVPAVGAIGVSAITSNVTMGLLAGIVMSVIMHSVIQEEEVKETKRARKTADSTKGDAKARRKQLMDILWELEITRDDIIEDLYEELLHLKSSLNPLEFPSYYKMIEEFIDRLNSISPEDVQTLFIESSFVLISLLKNIQGISLPSDTVIKINRIREKFKKYIKLFSELREIIQGDDEAFNIYSEIPIKPIELPEDIEREICFTQQKPSSRRRYLDFSSDGNITPINLPISFLQTLKKERIKEEFTLEH